MMPRSAPGRLWRFVIAVGLGLLGSCAAPGERVLPDTPLESQATVPSRFLDERVASVPSPTALAFLPDSTMVITTQPGFVRLVRDEELLGGAALDLSARVCAAGTQGLLGLAVDPTFSQNGYLYLYYTFSPTPEKDCNRGLSSAVVNRVSRFTLTGDRIDPASEHVLIDNIPSNYGGHNAGDLEFGKDGLLYITTGDGGCDYAGDSGCAAQNDAARDSHVLLGKILRITRTGDIPSSNPYRGSNSARCNVTGRTTAGRTCQETFASGLRNPFRFAFDPNVSSTRFFINDVGQNLWEEIDLGRMGADYGWNIREGRCATGSATNCGSVSGLTNPLFSYRHSLSSGILAGCASVTGGAFVPNDLWPGYDNSYLFSDYVCGKIFRLDNVSGSYRVSVLASGLGESSAVHLRFGPYGTTQALYYTSYAEGGEVRRIRYTGSSNQPPEATFTATPNSGTLPLTVSFDASGSRDPEGGALSYSWAFGDGGTANGLTPTHTYETAGSYTAILSVRDPQGATGTFSLKIAAGNTPPTPAVTSPAASALFGVGQTLTLRGSATDAEDGTLPAAALGWKVLLHHNTHTHPYAEVTGQSEVTLTMPPPEDLPAVTNSYLDVYLTATDSAGLSRTVYRKISPKLVGLTFKSNPTGLTLRVNGVNLKTPKTVPSWVGYPLNLEAPNQTTANGPVTFKSWSDGGAAAHTITSSTSVLTYTATYTLASQAVTGFTLMNAVTDAPVPGYNPIPNGATLNLARLPTRRLNIRANTTPVKVGSVRFLLNGRAYRTDWTVPYALASESGGNYGAWTPKVGRYMVKATPVSSGGKVGIARSLNFTVTDSR